jgi:transposase
LGTRTVGHGRRRVRVRDLPIAGRPVVLVRAGRIWRCPDPDCPTTTWGETTGAVRPRASATERARAEICRRVGRDEDPVAQAARAFGVGRHTAMAAVRDHADPLVSDPSRLGGTEAAGVDECRFGTSGPGRHASWATGFVDLHRARLADVVVRRSARVVAGWLEGRDQEWTEAVRVVALDPFRGYANGHGRPAGTPAVVVDHFHAVRLADAAVDDVRRRVQNLTPGHRGRRGDPLCGIRRLLPVGQERLDAAGRARVLAGSDAGDPDGEVGAALWGRGAAPRGLGRPCGPREARRRLVAFHQWCADAEVPELTRLATTIPRWEAEVLAYHTTGPSDGPTEAVNLPVEKIRRIGHGFSNFDNYRLRLLLRCGVKWQTPPVARIRGRRPCLVA